MLSTKFGYLVFSALDGTTGSTFANFEGQTAFYLGLLPLGLLLLSVGLFHRQSKQVAA